MPTLTQKYAQVEALIQEGSYSEAISLAETYLEEHEEDPKLLLLLAEACIYNWELKKADDLLLVIQELDLNKKQKNQFSQLRIHYYVNCARMELSGDIQLSDDLSIEYPKTKEAWEKAVRFYKIAKTIKNPNEENRDRLDRLEPMTVGLTDFMESTFSGDEDDDEEMDPGMMMDFMAQVVSDMSKNGDEDDDEDYYSEYTAEDELAHKKVREIFELWGEKTNEEGEVTRSPQHFSHIRKTDKILAQIEMLNYSHERLKEIVENITEVNNYYREVTPDTRKVVLTSIGVSVFVLLVLVLTPLLMNYNPPSFTYDEADWVLYRDAEMWFDTSIRERDTELHERKRVLRAGTAVTPLARMRSNWIQVRTSDGEKGFIQYNNFAGAQQITLSEDAPVINRETNQPFDTLKAGSTVTLTHHVNKPWETIRSAKVRTPAGRNGEIDYWRSEIRFPMLRNLPNLNQTFRYPTRKDRLEEETIGKPLDEVEKMYGPASSSMKYKTDHVAYYRHLEYTDQKKRYSGVYFTMNDEGLITGFTPRDNLRYGLTERLPLVQTMRYYQPFGANKLNFYESAAGEGNWFSRLWYSFLNLHWTTKILGVIIQIAIALVAIFIIFSIPRLFVSPVIYMTSHWNKLTNSQVRMISSVAIFTSFYLYWIWISLLSGTTFESLIASAFLIVFWRKRDFNAIYYKRCPNCHTMNVSQEEGSEFKGTSQEVSWSTYDVYKGSRTSGNVTTNYYDRRWKSKTTDYAHYDDHMSCRRCGHEWTVERTQKKGSSTQRH
jgi:tetratricopeptide (TPR) repeat protein